MTGRRGILFYGAVLCGILLLYLAFISLLPQGLYLQLVRREAAVSLSITPATTGAITEQVTLRRERTSAGRLGRRGFVYPLTVRQLRGETLLRETRRHIQPEEFKAVWNDVLEHDLITFAPARSTPAHGYGTHRLVVEWQSASARMRSHTAKWDTPPEEGEAAENLARSLAALVQKYAPEARLQNFPSETSK